MVATDIRSLTNADPEQASEVREMTAEEISLVAGAALTNAFSDAIKSLGEALSTAARKQ